MKGIYTMKYILAFTAGAFGQGSAIAILERRPRRGAKRERQVGLSIYVDQDWIDDHVVTHLERIPPGESIPESAARVQRMLTGRELVRDVDLVLDVTTYGRGLMEMFYKLDPAPPQYRVAIGGEAETIHATLGGWSLPERDVRAALTLHAQEGRFKVAEGLPLGGSLLRALENPDGTGDRDIYLATAIAVWLGRRCQTWGPWPSSKPPPPGSAAAHELEMIAIDKHDERRRRERREEASWRRGYGPGWDE